MEAKTNTIKVKTPEKKPRAKKTQRTLSGRIRKLILAGKSNQEIIIALNLKKKPQVVYNVRYQVNKKMGLGGLTAAPTQQELWDSMERFGLTETQPAPKASMWQRFKAWFVEKTND